MATSGVHSSYPYNLLSLLALRIHLLSSHTPCVNPSHSRVDALRYQLDFVNFGLRRYYEEGAVRLLLADDVGLGKTIMAGLLIKKLMMGGYLKRVLSGSSISPFCSPRGGYRTPDRRRLPGRGRARSVAGPLGGFAPDGGSPP